MWTQGIVITLGFIVSMVLCMPIGFLNLDENMKFQYVSFLVMCVGLIDFYAQWFTHDVRRLRARLCL